MKIVKYLALVVVVINIHSCTDVLLPDLESVEVEIVNPTTVDTTNSAVIHYWWKEVVEAKQYRLQIVSPSYGSLSKVNVDTTTSELSMLVSTLPKGDYEWTIRAVNSISETENPKIHKLYIEEAIDLTSFKVKLTNPLESATLKNPTLNLRWDGHSSVDQYTVKLYRVANTEEVFVKDIDVSSNANPAYGYMDTVLNDLAIKEYQWRVEARNSTTEAIDSDWGYFKLDTTNTNNP